LFTIAGQVSSTVIKIEIDAELERPVALAWFVVTLVIVNKYRHSVAVDCKC
jgi:hypothetical protein